jgi:predicted aminopeptidase
MLPLLLVSCDSLQFYTQAIRGQLSIASKRENIQSLVDDPATDAALRAQLETILEIRRFAETELALPVNNNFSSYVNIERPYVVWNVFAAPEFSLESDDWCFPVAGCVTYRGYFSEAAAENFAGNLETEGKDVYVGGVAAYSTLGWFADPVLNTVINRDEFRLAALIFHELAHQVVYIPGESEFNESFATAVELEGLRRWVEREGDRGASSNRVESAIRENEHRQEFVELVQSYRPQLESLYKEAISTDEKKRAKAALIDQLREDYAVKKQQWQGYDAYDGWFVSEINNAKLNTVATYFNLVPAFDALLTSVNSSLPDFYEEVEEFSELAAVERKAALASLIHKE